MNNLDNCKEKKTFYSEIEARKERGWAETEHKKKFSIYNCNKCNGWHLASIKFIIAINVMVGI